VVKVDVVGLLPDTLYYATAHTDPAAGGSFVLPNLGALPVETARLTPKVSITNNAIVNELIVRDVGLGTAEGTLLVLSVRGLSQYPVTAFFGKHNLAATEALVDLNNVFAQGTRESAEVVSGDVLEMTWFRGGIVTDLLIVNWLTSSRRLHTRKRHRSQAPPKVRRVSSLIRPVMGTLMS
jgi:hypothetical protein